MASESRKKIQTLITEGKHQEALDQLTKLDDSAPNVVERGRALAGLGQFSKAAEEFTKAAHLYGVMEEVKPVATEAAPTPPQTTPSSTRPKFDWYQSASGVFVSIPCKNAAASDLQVSFKEQQVVVTVKDRFQLELALYLPIATDKSSFSNNGFKVQLKLEKAVPGQWPTLEVSTQSAAAVPTTAPAANVLPAPYASKKSPKDWSKLEKEVDDEKEEDDQLNGLLKKIYKDADEDTRRAMIKSYQTSGGTVLTTNWDDASKKDYQEEIKPPKGQVYKSWDGKVISEEDQ